LNDLQIDFFMAVATNRSFTKTSEELFVSQPAISKQISMLEKELGVKLFHRNNKITELTKAGELFYEFFRDYKNDLRFTMQKAAALEHKGPKMIHLAFLEGWDMSDVIHEFLDRFHKRYPDIKVMLDCCGAKELSTMLLTNNVDIVLTLQNTVSEIDAISTKDVSKVRKVLLYSSRSPYAEVNDLQLSDFKNETFYAPWGILDKLITRAIASYCEPYEFVPRIEFVRNSESMITCVRNGLGVAILDDWNWCINSDDLRVLPLETTDTVCIASIRSGISEPVQYAVYLLTNIVREIHP